MAFNIGAVNLQARLPKTWEVFCVWETSIEGLKVWIFKINIIPKVKNKTDSVNATF